MYVLGTLIWVLLCYLIARICAKFIAEKSGRSRLRLTITLLMMPTLFAAPLADEIIGKYQFDRLCEEAKEIKIHGTHPVGEELYTADGRWRVGATPEEEKRLREIYESLARWDSGSPFPEVVPAIIVINKWREKIFDRKTGQLLAEWNHYGTPGGWLGRKIGGPILVKPQCFPSKFEAGTLHLYLFPFKGNPEVRK